MFITNISNEVEVFYLCSNIKVCGKHFSTKLNDRKTFQNLQDIIKSLVNLIFMHVIVILCEHNWPLHFDLTVMP